MKKAEIQLRSATLENIQDFKKVNFTVFPISYDNKFYSTVLKLGDLARVAYYNNALAGAMCCRLDTSNHIKRIYIMTLGMFYQYRRRGIGTAMLQHILNYALKDSKISSIFLHVQVSNKEAVAFYEKFGFEIVKIKKNYYKRIQPADAYILERKLQTEDQNIQLASLII